MMIDGINQSPAPLFLPKGYYCSSSWVSSADGKVTVFARHSWKPLRQEWIEMVLSASTMGNYHTQEGFLTNKTGDLIMKNGIIYTIKHRELINQLSQIEFWIKILSGNLTVCCGKPLSLIGNSFLTKAHVHNYVNLPEDMDLFLQ